LTKNEPPLKRVIDASHRPRRYDPLYSDVDGTMIGIQLPGTVMLRQVAQALTARATLRIAEDDFDGTWADLLACHRLARLTGQGPNLVDALTGTGLESAACQGDQLLLANLHIDAKQAARMQKGLGELLPLPKMADTIDVEARFTFLDSAMTVLRDIRKHPQAKPTFLGRFLPGGGDADWDLVLRMGRSWYDRMVDAVHRPTRAERQRALRTIEADFDAFIAGLKNQGDLSKILNGRTLRSQAIFGVVYAMLAPNARICSDGDDRAAMVLELTKVACALIGYRADHGSYPNQLAELSPKYIVEIPLDVFSGKPLRYVRYGNDMLLYSVGVNERDDGGRDYNDWLGAPEDVILLPCDDLVVRLPVAFQYSEQ
jgi:hypothetical protein